MAQYHKAIGSNPIEWTGRTWNPVTGCTKVSAGCKHCYAERMALRLQRMGQAKYRDGFAVRAHADLVTEPTGWQSSEWVFVNSMGDLLHEDLQEDLILDVFRTMAERAPWHRYQVLTKRAWRWEEVSRKVVERFGSWPRNVLPGASVENVRHGLPRVSQLRRAGDARTVRMLSVEPLLESVAPGGVEALAAELQAAGIGWVITGGEAGDGARPADLDWFHEVRDACRLAGVPFFHKQHGGTGSTKEGKRGGTLAVLDGRLHHEMPEVWAAPAPGRTRSEQAALFGA